MSRHTRLRPGELDEAQQALYDSITGGRRAAGPQLFRLTEDDGSLTGPFSALLLVPAIGRHVSRLGEAIRFESSLDGRTREIATLAVAAHWKSDFEQYAHEPLARRAGLDEQTIARIREPESCGALDDPADDAVHQLARRAVSATMDDATWENAVAVLGEAAAVEVLVLVGYYTQLAIILDALAIGLPTNAAGPAR
ncbi:MAG TPA: carboxymuconolactone decarboxylase family protein [Ilumatobacteraceae bacterium]|nr:carboxymuconolactone decarboxylase family protein [Ilumatobacteraceae bacterium]